MGGRLRGIPGFLVAGLFSIACAHSADTVVHVSAPPEAQWEVRNTEGAVVCSLPSSIELDERESVSVVRSDGRMRFVLRQENFGEGAFSASVRIRSERTRSSMAARVFAGALSGAGSVLAESRDREQAAAGALLSGMGAAVMIASDDDRGHRTELWVQRTSGPVH